jgi:hypothetical protein
MQPLGVVRGIENDGQDGCPSRCRCETWVLVAALGPSDAEAVARSADDDDRDDLGDRPLDRLRNLLERAASSTSRRPLPRPARTAMTLIVSAIITRDTVTTTSWMSCSSRCNAPVADRRGSFRSRPDGRSPRPRELEDPRASHLADRDAVRPQPQRQAHKVAQRRDAVLSASATRFGALHLSSRVSSIRMIRSAAPRHFGGQRIDERRLAG